MQALQVHPQPPVHQIGHDLLPLCARMADEVELAAVPKQAAAPDGELSKLVAEPACVVHPKVGPRAAKELESGGHLVPRPPWKPPLREKCEPRQKGDKALETREVWVG